MADTEISIGLREKHWEELLALLEEALDRSRSLEQDERINDLKDAILGQLDREVPPR